MIYNSYNAFMRAAGLNQDVLGPGMLPLGYGRVINFGNKNRPADFHVAKAAMPYMNSPGRLQSTWVGNMRYIPTAQTMIVQMGPKSYTMPMSPHLLSTWLTSSSLGRFFNNHLKGRF